MLQLDIDYAFNIANANADAFQFNVFSENIRAKSCYESVGFVIIKTNADAFSFKDESWGRYNMIKMLRFFTLYNQNNHA